MLCFMMYDELESASGSSSSNRPPSPGLAPPALAQARPPASPRSTRPPTPPYLAIRPPRHAGLALCCPLVRPPRRSPAPPLHPARARSGSPALPCLAGAPCNYIMMMLFEARGRAKPRAAKARRAQVLPSARWVLIAERGTERGEEGRAYQNSHWLRHISSCARGE
jgi:hypothetical protein